MESPISEASGRWLEMWLMLVVPCRLTSEATSERLCSEARLDAPGGDSEGRETASGLLESVTDGRAEATDATEAAEGDRRLLTEGAEATEAILSLGGGLQE